MPTHGRITLQHITWHYDTNITSLHFTIYFYIYIWYLYECVHTWIYIVFSFFFRTHLLLNACMQSKMVNWFIERNSQLVKIQVSSNTSLRTPNYHRINQRICTKRGSFLKYLCAQRQAYQGSKWKRRFVVHGVVTSCDSKWDFSHPQRRGVVQWSNVIGVYASFYPSIRIKSINWSQWNYYQSLAIVDTCIMYVTW